MPTKIKALADLPPDYLETETIYLTKFPFGAKVKFSPELDRKDRIIYVEGMIDGWVWAKKIDEDHCKFPRDWWEAFKERWFPLWLLLRFPVEYAYYRFELHATYPDLNIMAHDPILKLIRTKE